MYIQGRNQEERKEVVSMWSFPLKFSFQIFYAFLISLMCASYQAHLVLHYHNIIIIMVKSAVQTTNSFSLLFHVTSFLLGPNILLSTLFTNTLNMSSFLKVKGLSLTSV
jgi:hypothetical protein